MMKATLLAAALALLAAGAGAHEYKAGSIRIDHPWARATPRGATVAAGYLKLTNTGSTPDRLVGGTSSASKDVEIHEMSMTDGVMKMRPIKGGLEIKPGQTVELKPGGSHLMFVNVKAPLKEGTSVPATLKFQRAGEVKLEFQVRPLAGGEHHGH